MDWSRMDLSLNPQEEDRCRKRVRPIIKQYASQTKFSHEELEALLIIHYKLSKERPIDRKCFRRLMFRMFDFSNDLLIDRIFSAFDRKNKLHITPDSWIIGMSIFTRGDLDEKIRFCFTVYDMMGDGYIKKEIMLQTLAHSVKGAVQDEDPEETVKEVIEMLLKKMDHDKDGKISFNDYKESVWQNESLLEFLGYCLPSRPAVYCFLTTFTHNLTTMHAKFRISQLSS